MVLLVLDCQWLLFLAAVIFSAFAVCLWCMAGDIELQLWERLIELRQDRTNLLELVGRLDAPSEQRVEREVTIIARRRALDLPPPPTHHTLLDIAVRNTQSHLVDLQTAIDDLRTELEFDYGGIQYGVSFVQCALFCTRACVSIGLPAAVGPTIARFLPNPTQRFPIPAVRSVHTLPFPIAD